MLNILPSLFGISGRQLVVARLLKLSSNEAFWFCSATDFSVALGDDN